MSSHHPAHPPSIADERHKILVFIRDTDRDLDTGYKTDGGWREGIFDASPWSEGEFRCDCARGPLVYSTGEFSCGTSRFVIERILVWDTGETVYSERELP